jgi:hypothetical protein
MKNSKKSSPNVTKAKRTSKALQKSKSSTSTPGKLKNLRKAFKKAQKLINVCEVSE